MLLQEANEEAEDGVRAEDERPGKETQSESLQSVSQPATSHQISNPNKRGINSVESISRTAVLKF